MRRIETAREVAARFTRALVDTIADEDLRETIRAARRAVDVQGSPIKGLSGRMRQVATVGRLLLDACGGTFAVDEDNGLGDTGMRLWIGAAAMLLGACATASPVMDAGNGVYLISAHASAVRGGATGAQTVAFKDAQEFCAKKGESLHPVVIGSQERDVYQSSFGGGVDQYGGSIGGGSYAAGNVNLRFRCEQ